MGDHMLASIPLAPSVPSPLPLTPRVLREAIASALERVSARELADECVRFGLPPHDPWAEEDPWRGKWRYVERRIRHSSCRSPFGTNGPARSPHPQWRGS
jgi:hypothetical protein